MRLGSSPPVSAELNVPQSVAFPFPARHTLHECGAGYVASSGDEIKRARPGPAAVALRHAHIDRKVGAARKRHDVIDGEAPAPVLLERTIDADPPAEAAAGGIQSDAPSAACAAIPERAATRARSTA